MSKKDQSLQSENQADESFVDDFSDEFSDGPQDDGSRMSREVKVGLAVIVLLIGVLGYVVYNQFSSSGDDDSSVAEKEPAEDPEDDGSDPGSPTLSASPGGFDDGGSNGLSASTSRSRIPWDSSGISPSASADSSPPALSGYMPKAPLDRYTGYGTSGASGGTTNAMTDTTPRAAGQGTGYTYGQQSSSSASSAYPALTTGGTNGTPATAGSAYATTAGQGTETYLPSGTSADVYPRGQTTESTGGMTPLGVASDTTQGYSTSAAGSQGTAGSQSTPNPLRGSYSSAGSAVAAQPAPRYGSDSFSSSGSPGGYSSGSSSQPAASSGYASGQSALGSGQSSYKSGQSGYGSSYSTGRAASGTPGYSSSGTPGYSSSGTPGYSSSGTPSYSSVAGSAGAAGGTYLVQPNDSFASISQRVYGTESYFKALAEYNRGAVLDPNQLKPRQVIETPSIAELEAQCPGLCPTAGHREIAQQRLSVVRTTSQFSGGRTYVVQEGDSLFDIAKFELGKASRWDEIWQLNRDVLGDDWDYVSPGLELVLPAEQSTGGTLTQRPGTTGPYR